MLRYKILVFVIALSMLLAACQSATEAPVVEEPAAEEPVAEEPAAFGELACSPNCTPDDLVVGFLQTGSEGGWRAANTASFK